MPDEGRQRHLKERGKKYGFVNIGTEKGKRTSRSSSHRTDELKHKLPPRHPGLDARGRLNTPKKQMSWKDAHKLASKIRPTPHDKRNTPEAVARSISYKIHELMNPNTKNTAQIESDLKRLGVDDVQIRLLVNEKTNRRLRGK